MEALQVVLQVEVPSLEELQVEVPSLEELQVEVPSSEELQVEVPSLELEAEGLVQVQVVQHVLAPCAAAAAAAAAWLAVRPWPCQRPGQSAAVGLAPGAIAAAVGLVAAAHFRAAA